MKIKTLPPAATSTEFPLLIKSLLSYSLMLEPEREIVYKDLVRYNYYTFNERVRRLSNALGGMGLDGGETVAVMDYDSHRYLECYFAVPMTGNVLHMINWRLAPAQILYTINHAEDAVLIVNEDFLPLIEQFSGQMPTVRHIIVASDGPSINRTHPGYESLLDASATQFDFPDFDENAVATTFYTTGTTGDPKGVYFTHRQLVLHTLNLAATFGFVESASCRCHSDDVYMPLTPMFHVHAWGFPYLATMFSMKQVYTGKLAPPVVADLIRREKPTFSHCVPTVLQMILLCPEVKEIDLSGWKVMIGGSALTRALAKLALERGVDVSVGYGMSETCPVIASSYIRKADADMEEQLTVRTRSGIPTILTDLQVWNEYGRPVATDDKESGEIVVRAPWLTQGYVKDPERGAALWRDGYLHTGDVATMNEKHSLKISDRIKDVIKSGGEWISSIHLEGLIGLHTAVAEAAVVGLPHSKWGERPYALVVLNSETRVEQAELKEHIRQFIDQGHISKWAMPEEFIFVSAIPKTSVGKIDKKRIRSEWESITGK
ncbi:MAG TPA: fatty acid--CoA ligase [Puia sp.]|nr:fatty acid--CoA ligase [Puia sp.]